ncbi:MAG: transketolase family protein [Nitrososphaeria archaeon]|nr:transketolase family protein [Nitrososphaeria archaeon]
MSNQIASAREAFGETLIEIGKENDNVIVLDPDVSASTKTFIFRNMFPNRFINVGISEQDMIGIAAGLALEGFIPIVTGFSMFILRGWEQIRNTIARDKLNVKIIATHSGLSDFADGASHQCLEDIALMRVLPGMNVVVPSDPTSIKSLLKQLVYINGPCYMRIGRDFAPKIYESEDEIVFGKANLLEEGSDLTIIACGLMVYFSLEVREKLLENGFNAAVVDLHTIKPLDRELNKVCGNSDKVVTIEEHNIIGGMGAAVCEILSEKGFRIKRLGVPDMFGESSRNYLQLLEKCELNVKIFTKNILNFVKGELS